MLTENVDSCPILQTGSNYFVTLHSKVKGISNNRKTESTLSPNEFETLSLKSNPCDDEKSTISEEEEVKDSSSNSNNNNYISNNKNTRNNKDKNGNSSNKILKATKLTKIYPKKKKRKKLAIAVMGDSMTKKIYGPAYSDNKQCICKIGF